MQKKWEIDPELCDSASQKVKILSNEIKCPLIIAEILYRNKITDKAILDSYFNPSLDMLHDPFLFSDMKKAVTRVLHAIDTGEKITIYGDYDVDGTTATALLYLGLKEINAVVDFYIPHRMTDGYGLSIGCLEAIRASGTQLIITVDCGIIALDEIEKIEDMGMEIIITDHHNSKATLPKAVAIINPKLESCTYPFKDLAGVGVAYKLLMAIYITLGIYTEENLTKYLDLVALGTIADIVSLTNENRVFAHIGLLHLSQRKNNGIKELLNLSGITKINPDTNDIIFGIAPRINAAGRMGCAMRAVELLISTDKSNSRELAEIIERENSLRQQIDHKTYDEACDIINKKYKDMKETYCIVISSDNWHPGVIGIVASKIIEKYNRPTIMITHSEGIGSGSGRSVADFDLFQALKKNDDLLENFGGHKYAVGLTILPEYIEAFENRLNDYIKQTTKLEDLKPLLKINKKIELYDITYKLMEWLAKLAPYGINNSMPVFFTENVMVQGYPYNVGKNHLKIKVKKDGCELDLIGFNLGDYLSMLKNDSKIDIVYTLELTTWQGKTSIQGNLKDIRFIRQP